MGYPDHSRLVTAATQLGLQRSLVLWDDSTRPMDWTVDGTGADPVVAASTDFGFIGPKSLKLSSRSTLPATNDIASAKIALQYPFKDRLFVGCRVLSPDVSTLKLVGLLCRIRNGAQLYEAKVYHSHQTATYSWIDVNDLAVTIDAAAGSIVDKTWIFLGMELDLALFEYAKVFTGGVTVDLTGQKLFKPSTATGRFIEIEVDLLVAGNQQSHAYFDTIYCGDCECV